MTLRVVDEPTDRPAWVREAIGVMVREIADARDRLLVRVASWTDAELTSGSEDDWGPGQIATHLLIVERGSTQLALRLARGEPPGPTGQPRPAASAVSRASIAGLAEKTAAACARVLTEFPAEPNAAAVARHPYYGDLNCFGWLLMLPIHYRAHLDALDQSRPSAL